MDTYQSIAVFLASFALITISSRRIGQFFGMARLPMITGYLATGILAGPYVLGLLSLQSEAVVRFVDEMALGFIAFSAGGELYLKELLARMKSIRFVTIGLVVSTFTLGSMTVFMLADYIPFMQEMPAATRIAVSILAGAILVARSPSSAIAVIHELRAKGPFTQTALGVTVVMDVVVIVIFSVNSSLADGLVTGLSFNFRFVILLLAEILVSVALGVAVWGVLKFLLARRITPYLKTAGILLAGYGVFFLSDSIREYSSALLGIEVLLEPLLICMIAGFLITNYGPYRDEFLNLLHGVGPAIYAVFFTLTGATLALDILSQIWVVSVAIFIVRLAAIFIGSFLGGTFAGDPASHNRIGWMAFVTQAGVGLGLAKEVAGAFPEWGSAFATLMISVIMLNQVIGPSLFKLAITLVREAHPRAKKSDIEALHRVVIFGSDGQAMALARQLRLHDWEVKVAHKHSGDTKVVEGTDVHVYPLSDYGLEPLREIGVGAAGAIVAMLSDEENYQICETAYENFGNTNLVVQLVNRAHRMWFTELGAFVVAPSTAIISLLDHYVRSPSAVSLLLGMEEDKDIIDMEVRNPNLQGAALRELRMPRDILIISHTREGKVMKVNGYTQFQVGDSITVSGLLESLEEVSRRLGS